MRGILVNDRDVVAHAGEHVGELRPDLAASDDQNIHKGTLLFRSE